MSGSPPQIETIGASHSTAAWRHCSSGTMSLSDVEYSRMRPQPVQVRLQVCSGSSCKTIANFGVLRSLCLMMWLAIFFVRAKGKRIDLFRGSEFVGVIREDGRRIRARHGIVLHYSRHQ